MNSGLFPSVLDLGLEDSNFLASTLLHSGKVTWKPELGTFAEDSGL